MIRRARPLETKCFDARSRDYGAEDSAGVYTRLSLLVGDGHERFSPFLAMSPRPRRRFNICLFPGAIAHFSIKQHALSTTELATGRRARAVSPMPKACRTK